MNHNKKNLFAPTAIGCHPQSQLAVIGVLLGLCGNLFASTTASFSLGLQDVDCIDWCTKYLRCHSLYPLSFRISSAWSSIFFCCCPSINANELMIRRVKNKANKKVLYPLSLCFAQDCFCTVMGHRVLLIYRRREIAFSCATQPVCANKVALLIRLSLHRCK